MKARRIDEDYWEVESTAPTKSGKRQWWTVKRLPHLPGGYLIMNSKGVQVAPTGALGNKILKAITEVMRWGEGEEE